MINRVEITDKAADIVARLEQQHGALMFHQSGGCCDGSSPMCYPAGDFRVGPQDVLLGKIAGCDFYIGAAQFEYWQHTQLIIDVVPISRRPLFSERLLLVAALLAGEFHPGRALRRRDAIRRAAFAAGCLDAGVALLDDNGLALHRLADQALGFLTHRLLRHPLPPVTKKLAEIAP
jgi:uncharacterized protein (DUF779 family)